MREIRRRIPSAILGRMKRYRIAGKVAGWSDELPWEGRLSSKLEEAQRNGWLEEPYAGWDDLLGSARRDHTLHVIELEQHAQANRPYGWRISGARQDGEDVIADRLTTK